MAKVWATTLKELRQLWRDRAGLLVLFGMPAALVLIVCLIHENVLQATRASGLRVLVVNQDDGPVGQALATELLRAPSFTATLTADPEAARQAVRAGRCQFAVAIPAGTSAAVRRRARALAERGLVPAPAAGQPAPAPLPPAPPAATLRVWCAPTLQGAVRAALHEALARLALSVELAERGQVFEELFPAQVKRLVAEATGADANDPQAEPLVQIPAVKLDLGRETLLGIADEPAVGPGQGLPTSVQQNVPAWALFGMFFLVVPLAGSLIRERQQGTLARLLVMPTPLGAILLGKVLAYVAVGVLQFALMLLLGVTALPWLGTPMLTLGPAPVALAVLVLSCALAAASYGLMVGLLARSYEQASMFGAVSVVIAAALGGIMVPVFAMPPVLRAVSAWSPLAWGLEGFLDLFVRGGGFLTILPRVAELLAFAALCLGGAALAARRRGAGRLT